MPVSTARSNRSGSAALGLHDGRLDKNGAALAKVAGVLAPPRCPRAKRRRPPGRPRCAGTKSPRACRPRRSGRADGRRLAHRLRDDQLVRFEVEHVADGADDARVAGNAAGEDNGLMDGETAHDRRLIVADHRVAQAEQNVLLGDALLLAVDDVGLGEHGAASVSARPDARRASCSAARRSRRPACRPEREVKKPWFLAHLW